MVVAVPVGPMQAAAMLVRNPLDRSRGGGDVETAGGANRDPAQMRPGLLAGKDNGLHQIPGLESLDRASAFRPGAGESVLVHPAHLATAPSRRDNGERPLLGIEIDGGPRLTDTGGIDPMGFRVVLAGAVELGPTAGPERHRQAVPHGWFKSFQRVPDEKKMCRLKSALFLLFSNNTFQRDAVACRHAKSSVQNLWRHTAQKASSG